jgi:hypothetical protein
MNKIKISEELQNKLNSIYSSKVTKPVAKPVILQSAASQHVLIKPDISEIPPAPPMSNEEKDIKEVKKIKVIENENTSTRLTNIISTNTGDDSVSTLLKFIVTEHINTYLELKEFKKKYEKEMELKNKKNS